MSTFATQSFLSNLPKIELHAHLNGSLNIQSIRELSRKLYGDNTPEFQKLCQQFIDFEGLTLDDCFRKFKFMHELTSTQCGLKLATQLVIRDFQADHVVYLELRTTPKANEHMSKEDYLKCVLQSIVEAQQQYGGINVKLLPSVDRAQAPSEAADTLEIALKLRTEFPNIITGLDLSGNPAYGKFADFVQVLQKAREHDLKLTLHCAEMQNPSEVKEMLNFGMDRCGHGTFLSGAEQELLKERKVPIECCLSSNVKCNTVPSYANHHFKDLFKQDNITVLCTDDCGVFDTSLTREFLIAVQSFQLNSKDIYQLSLNAVEYAFASDEEKQALRIKIQQYFKANKF